MVDNLDNLDSVKEDLERVGRIHARMGTSDFSGKIWNVLAETFIDCTLEWGDRRARSETVRKAWALIIAFIVEKIRRGYTDQVYLP